MALARTIYLIIVLALVGGVVIQVFLAGLGVFDDPETFLTHATWGYLLETLPLAMLLAALFGRLGGHLTLAAAALLGMFFLQSMFIAVRVDLPMVAALHPVNGFGILLVSVLTAREAWATRLVRPTMATTAPPVATEPLAER